MFCEDYASSWTVKESWLTYKKAVEEYQQYRTNFVAYHFRMTRKEKELHRRAGFSHLYFVGNPSRDDNDPDHRDSGSEPEFDDYLRSNFGPNKSRRAETNKIPKVRPPMPTRPRQEDGRAEAAWAEP